MSPAEGPDCIPHQGGQNFPGLPIFIAFVWSLFGTSDRAFLLSQLGVLLAAIAWLLRIVQQFDAGRRVALVLALLLTVSPLTMPWVRFVAITETLSLAFSVWVLAEILLSIRTGQFQAFRMALAFAAAVFMRAENALLILPIVLTAWYARRELLPKRALIFAATAAVPFVAFIGRNVSVGLPPLSPPEKLYQYTMPVYPSGFMSWTSTWMVTEYERADALFPILNRLYSRILIRPSAYVGAEEQERVSALVTELRNYDDQAFPRHIDAQFRAIALEKGRQQGLGTRLGIYLKRVQSLWLNPYSSYGFPIESENREHRAAILRELSQPGIGKFFRILAHYPSEVLGRGLIFAYKATMLLGFCLSVAAFRKYDQFMRKLVLLVALAVVPRTVVFAAMGSPPLIEARYMVSVVPWLEVLFAFMVVDIAHRLRRSSAPARVATVQ